MRTSDRIGPHDLDVVSVLVGCLLGDGYASQTKGKIVGTSFLLAYLAGGYIGTPCSTPLVARLLSLLLRNCFAPASQQKIICLAKK